MSLRPFWRYYGGKWRIAPRYPSPTHGKIVEPFAGSAGYSLRHADLEVTLVEKYAELVEMWRWLIGSSAADVMAVPCTDHLDSLPSSTPEGARVLVGFMLGGALARPIKNLTAGSLKLREMGRKRIGWCEEHP